MKKTITGIILGVCALALYTTWLQVKVNIQENRYKKLRAQTHALAYDYEGMARGINNVNSRLHALSVMQASFTNCFCSEVVYYDKVDKCGPPTLRNLRDYTDMLRERGELYP
tara:strand:- start:716 stop:1051 length:336 start_codon:yes stop_codon:yes gene_type:complete